MAESGVVANVCRDTPVCAPQLGQTRASAPASAGQQISGLAALAFGHTVCDFYATFLTPLLPLLLVRFKLSTFMGSLLVAAVAISGSTLQPVIGAIGGAGRSKGAIVVGMFMMAVFFSCLGFAPNLPTLFAILLVGALGCSLFHPHAASIATRISSGRRGMAMSLFTVAGTAGIFMSPKIVPRIVTMSPEWGLKALVLTMPLGLVCAVVLALLTPMAPPETTRRERTEWRGLVSGDVPGLATLVVSAILYSLTICGLCTFLPLMLCGERNYSLTQAGDMLSWLILAGAVGVVLGGYLSDRIGRWRVIMGAYLLSVPLFSGFLAANGVLAQILLMAGGVALWSAQPCTITLAQELVPHAARIASGMVMGFAWGMAGLFLPIFGLIADRAGTSYAMRWIVLLPIGAAVSLCVMKRYARSEWV